ncbi:choline/ethanolamine kinase [Theileria orientalis strain Shintoku]|uniref:ethanolamine kinase n=1 Tax=Theileria orientalis strain Shintoku TaxID=869250 RepID=J4C892_THEOR|nr:choline/ethanolamine kinase [Theileria orientalis strain Shintoku]BAM40383.1 choline/ethanolamine kinase [Theileria orientalis strain Shintoku]|eukprot:XP_009690684.1 choline/ethanolamine kinase [Theileria orientalis strain Shintoku]
MFDVNEVDNCSSSNRVPVKYTKYSHNHIENKLYCLNDHDSKLIKDICIKNIPFWNNLDYKGIKIEIAPNSVSNLVFFVNLICENNEIYPNRTVILKKRTSYSNVIYDRELQLNVAELLGENNLGPRVICRCSDYTIQEFVEGTTLKNSSFQNLSVITSLASTLAKFHRKGTEISLPEWDRTPFVLRHINKWTEPVERIIKKHNLDFDFNELQSSFELYKTLLNNHIKTSNSVANSVLFCHNDLYSENIINFQQGIFLIDFDFSGFNYVGWDISTFFCKMGFLYDVTTFPYFVYDKTLEPSDEFKSIFVSIYLSELLNKNVLPSENVVKEFLDSLDVHRLGVQLYWTYWGIIMSDRPSNELAIKSNFSSQSKVHLEVFNAYYNKIQRKQTKL